MPAIISVFEMRCAEQEAMASGIPERELMFNAGVNAAREIVDFCRNRLPVRHRRRYFVVAGGGNNGGDAFVVAHHLDCPAVVYTTAAEHRGAAAEFREGLEFVDEFRPEPGDVIIDGLLGIGLNGPVRPETAGLIQKINLSGLPVISLDVPSGLNADDGSGESVVIADMTVTMHSPKQGLFVGRGIECSGVLRVVGIGIENTFSSDEHAMAFGGDEARLLLGRRRRTSHKYDFGHVLCLAGSSDYPGASVLAARAAGRIGAGLVTLAVPGKAHVDPVDSSIILRNIGSGSCFSVGDLDALDMSRYSAILYGPGTGRNVEEEFLMRLLALDVPLVIDADGLRLLAASGKRGARQMLRRTAPVLLTPHDGELAALKDGIPEILQMMPSCLFIIHKGPQTKVHSPEGAVSINMSGGPALATAGSGDVLAGMTASLLAQKMDPWDAARLAVFVHGHAVDISALPDRSVVADDLLELVPDALADISPLA